MQKAELINQSSVPRRNTVYPLHQLLPLPSFQVIHTDRMGSMGHSHENMNVSHLKWGLSWLEAAPVYSINHSSGKSEMKLPQVSLWLLQLLPRHNYTKINNSLMTRLLVKPLQSFLCLCSLICQTHSFSLRNIKRQKRKSRGFHTTGHLGI